MFGDSLFGFEQEMGSFENDLNLEATELRLGLPGTEESEKSRGIRSSNKRPLSESKQDGDEVHEEGPKAASSPKYVLLIILLRRGLLLLFLFSFFLEDLFVRLLTGHR